MKKLFSVLVILCWLALPGQSQGRQQRPTGEMIETMKIGFITQRLNLTPDEAQKFWPIYKIYSSEVRQVYGVYRSNNNELQLDESLLNIRKRYSVEFLKAISPGKINDFFKAEKDFSSFVRKEMQRRQMQHRGFPSDQ
jgi:hypothetical protein